MPRKRKGQPDGYYDAFPSRLREVMEKNGATQQEVANVICRKRQSVGNYMDGSAGPDWKTLVTLAKYFNVSADWLLGLSEVKSQDISTKQMCEKTGFSENAILAMIAQKDNSPAQAVINALLSDTDFLMNCTKLGNFSISVAFADEYERNTPYCGEDIQLLDDSKNGVFISGYDVCSLRYNEIIQDITKHIDKLTGMSQLQEYVKQKRKTGLSHLINHISDK